MVAGEATETSVAEEAGVGGGREEMGELTGTVVTLEERMVVGGVRKVDTGCRERGEKGNSS